MKISVILGHPAKGSFNHAIAETTKRFLSAHGHKVFFHDLYEERFDPILPSGEIAKDGIVDRKIQRYCNELMASDGIVIIHPNWWGQPPAILKGWIDRVIRAGVAYEFEEGDGGEGIPIGLLRGKKAVVFNTSNTPEERERTYMGDPLESLWKICIFDLCGIKDCQRKMYGVICDSTDKERRAWLKDVEKTLASMFRTDED
jgi:putative NADPH-quinone reductase